MQLLGKVHRTAATVHIWNRMHVGCSSVHFFSNSCISQTLIHNNQLFRLGQSRNLLLLMSMRAYNNDNHGIRLLLLLLLLLLLTTAVAIVVVVVVVPVAIAVIVAVVITMYYDHQYDTHTLTSTTTECSSGLSESDDCCEPESQTCSC